MINKPDKELLALNHVAIIMDGNGRWAKERGLSRLEGHKKGAENVETVIQAAKEASIPFITLYAFSTENWSRPKLEIKGLMQLLNIFLKKNAKKIINEEICFRVIGNYSEFEPKLVKLLKDLIEKTSHFKSQNLTLALNYSARTEVLKAIQSYTETLKDKTKSQDALDWKTFSSFLDTQAIPDPDLIIRTSGEYRLSNFLLLQGAYAEIYVTQTYWPDFNKEAFKQAITFFHSRERRFGKTSDQIQKELTPS